MHEAALGVLQWWSCSFLAGIGVDRGGRGDEDFAQPMEQLGVGLLWLCMWGRVM